MVLRFYKIFVFTSFFLITSSFANSDKPNVIYILADDAGINNIGVYGGEMITTPNIDQIAEEGIQFTNHYSGASVCAPSRSVLMTGKDTGRTRIRHNLSSATLESDDVTVAELFKQAGYRTGMVGKWGLGYEASEGVPNKQGFDEFFGFLDHGNAHRYYPEFLWRNQEKVFYENNQTLRTSYSHDLFSEEALSFIDESQATENKDQPFFLYLAFTVPHVDLDVPEDSMAPYLGKLGDDRPSFFPWATLDGYKEHSTPKAAFAGMISRMDRDIGRILKKLKQLNISDNTLIMFASDNGPSSEGGAPIEFFNSNGVYRGGKRDFYDGGIRMPFVARWPDKIASGQTTDHLSGFVDLVPTVAELLNIDTNEHDGISFFPVLLGQKERQKKHEYLYWEMSSKFPLNIEKQAIRQGKYKLIRQSPLIWWTSLELYDLSIDPGEQNDVSDQYPDVVQTLERAMDNAHQIDVNYPLNFYSE